jgi:bifunctional DNA-binding transcriptional regulator/antitoxin component of YhaV-PrlF toxin-antitoxin module
MSATIVRKKRQTTLPIEVCGPAGIVPGDQIDWTYEAGRICGRKLVPVRERRVTAKLVRRGGKLFFEVPGGTERFVEAIPAAIEAERSER